MINICICTVNTARKMYIHITCRSQRLRIFESVGERSDVGCLQALMFERFYGDSLMHTFKLVILSAAASFSLGAVAHADVASNSTEVAAAKAVYEGKDSQGRIVRLTVSDPNVATFTRVPAVSPQLHWSARIGTGTAASLEH
jgi:hypothetical protein